MKSLRQVLGIGVTRPLCGIQRDGNRKSQGALAPLCEFPGSAALTSPLYSTVTLFARLRGLSTSNPFAQLM